jgi:small subunit ribosomal protein S8
MATSDTLADFLTQLRNAKDARHRFVDIRVTKQRLNLLKVLQEQGFIEHFLVNEDKGKMRIFLKYTEGRKPVLQGLRRMSSPSLRRYIGYRNIPKICGGMGITILSTPQGVVDGETARKLKAGGELICYIW